VVTESDADCIEKIKNLLSYLPDSCHAPLPLAGCADNAERVCTELDTIIPDKGNRAYDMKKIIKSLADNGEMFELLELWAQNIIIALIRIMGKPVGVIANNPRFAAGVLNVDASDKASRFIRFCDAFNIPLLTLTDVPGYMPGTHQEWAGIIRHGAKLLHAYSEATVPKITVIVRKAYGGAYIGMCSKQLGADYVMAWPTAEIAVMGAEGACNIVYRNEIAKAGDPAAKRAELAAAYEEQFNNPYFAASMGIIEEIIAPRDTRQRIIALLDALKDKKETRVSKKHNNIPL
jgi:propionyl-CoA carboxylase beta chain